VLSGESHGILERKGIISSPPHRTPCGAKKPVRIWKRGLPCNLSACQRQGQVTYDVARQLVKRPSHQHHVANNETGVIQPVPEIGAIAGEKNSLSHGCRAGCRKNSVHVDTLGGNLPPYRDKVPRPKGVGALYVREVNPLVPVVTGGHHEHHLRAGTENVPGMSVSRQPFP